MLASALGWLLCAVSVMALAHTLFTYAILYFHTMTGPRLQHAGGGGGARTQGVPVWVPGLLLRELLAETVMLLLSPGRLVPAALWHRLRLPGRGRPILVVHGYGHSPANVLYLGWRVSRATGRPVSFLRARPAYGPIEEQALELARRVDELRATSADRRVDIVAHSMAGLTARYYLQILGGDAHVGHLVTVATPHHGSRMAVFGLGRCAPQVLPGSSLLERLASEEADRAIPRLTSIWTPYDNIVIPPASSEIAGGATLRSVDGIGHNGLLFSGRTLRHVVSALGGEADHDDHDPTEMIGAVSVP